MGLSCPGQALRSFLCGLASRIMRTLVRLPSSHRGLLLQAACAVVIFSILLRLRPVGTLAHFLDRDPQRRSSSRDRARRIARAVTTASRFVPATTCLIRALAVLDLLDRNGAAGVLQLGVATGRDGRLQAHAWVEEDGQVVIGNLKDLSRFAVLKRVDRPSLGRQLFPLSLTRSGR